jgi:hypothetical protein
MKGERSKERAASSNNNKLKGGLSPQRLPLPFNKELGPLPSKLPFGASGASDGRAKPFPPTPPRTKAAAGTARVESSGPSSFLQSVYPDVIVCLKWEVVGVANGLFQNDCTTLALAQPKKFKSKPLWKKREVVRQERLVEYTTIDADGEMQELCEREVSETEVS